MRVMLTLSVALLLGCGAKSGTLPTDAATPDAVTPDAGAPDATTCGPDSDGDGIPDRVESSFDRDGDGQPNELDLDSDGDGLSDRQEDRDPDECRVSDCDSDGIPDFFDIDSDDDGVLDGEEVALGLDPCDAMTGECEDVLIASFGDCEDNAFLAVECFRDSELEVTFRVPSEATSARLRIETIPEVMAIREDVVFRFETVRATPFAPSDGETFVDVVAGTELVFRGIFFATDPVFTGPDGAFFGMRLVLELDGEATDITLDLLGRAAYCPCIC